MSVLRKLLLLVIAALALGCAREGAEAENDQASQQTYVDEAGVYKNDFFGLAVTPPQGWRSVSEVERAYIDGKSLEIAEGFDETLKKDIEVNRQRSPNVDLFSFCRNHQVEGRAAKLCVAGEAQRIGADVASGKSVLDLTRQTLGEASPSIVFFHTDTTRKIGGVTFHRLGIDMPIDGERVRQHMHAAKFGAYVILISETFAADEFERETAAMLDAISFAAE